MDNTFKTDTFYITHDSNVKLVTKEKEINIISNKIDTQAMTLHDKQMEVIIAHVPESQPMITDWLAAIGTILAVILSLGFSALAYYNTLRRNFVKINSIYISSTQSQTIELEATITNNSSVPLDVYSLWFQYNKQRGPMFPVFFRPKDEKITILPLNSQCVKFYAYKYVITNDSDNRITLARCNSFLEMAEETVAYLHQFQGAINNRLTISKKDFKKVLKNLNVGSKTNLDTERFFTRKLTTFETKYCTFQIIKNIDKVF